MLRFGINAIDADLTDIGRIVYLWNHGSIKMAPHNVIRETVSGYTWSRTAKSLLEEYRGLLSRPKKERPLAGDIKL